MSTINPSSSGLQFHIHPLVLINISDHATRMRANKLGEENNYRVLGCLLGQQSGRVVDISNSLEINYHIGELGIDIDEAYLTRKQEQYKQTFPKLDTVGWYSTGSEVEEADMQIHKMITHFNESPVYLLLDPDMNRTHKDLPVSLYESELHLIDGVPQSIFVQSKYTIETSEAERIGINQIAKVLPRGNDKGTDQLSAHYMSLHAAIKMLHGRLLILHVLLRNIDSGEIPYDHALIRQAASLVRQLPAIRAASFHQNYLVEFNDAMLTVYLSGITNGIEAVNDIVEKVSTAFDSKSTRRRGML
ncbi:Mov34-domain-containing protein [Coccomyxa subellipsoidea C-169]|uniref:COP9 signalosome complex subunit 6 n=1 Tax=Coccomyxa subellipsoidea (strain C-169) TaxID=574566 RepID=I0YWP1_COCSC|nr:Mov34-domain-containing protein [Coccomyxa subellipsoidea C-169]EIE22810.1 Mov34-domain-containing protein [Coccomyxa subellipsoidea C-169]|eukprot:XP_005647354.1 Mov34-domain-containing protein [Coccomyxa subellipsoidea C-169]